MNEEAVPYERKYEVELTVEEIELLKECLREQNEVLQRDLHQTITVQNAIENGKNNSYDDDFKEWNNRRLSAQYKEQAMIAHIENVFNNASDAPGTQVLRFPYDMFYKPISGVVHPSPLDGQTACDSKCMVRFKACPDKKDGYFIFVERR